jgi:uncharacterized MAPEG superfamily protein
MSPKPRRRDVAAGGQLVATAYICARVIFVLSYWLKIPIVRSLAWLAGMICCAAVTVLAVVP